MRILHVAESARGGVGSYLAYAMQAQITVFGQQNVRLVIPAQDRSQVWSMPDSATTTFPRADRSAAGLWALVKTVIREANTFRPDVIHAHSTFAGLVVRLLFGWTAGRPGIVYCPHGWAFNTQASRWKRGCVALVERLLSRCCDAVVAISSFEAAEARRIGIAPDRIKLIVSGIPEAPAVKPSIWEEQRLKVLFIGRLDRQKGADVLVAAAKSLADQISVRIVGAAVAGAGGVDGDLPSNVDCLGWLDERAICAQLAAADVVAIPSRWEGFGLVAAEAMRAGRAVVASRVGGLPELVDDGVTGRLVAPDSVDDLSRALTADSDDWMEMGRKGRARYMQRFTAGPMNTALIRLYREAADHAGFTAPAFGWRRSLHWF